MSEKHEPPPVITPMPNFVELPPFAKSKAREEQLKKAEENASGKSAADLRDHLAVTGTGRDKLRYVEALLDRREKAEEGEPTAEEALLILEDARVGEGTLEKARAFLKGARPTQARGMKDVEEEQREKALAVEKGEAEGVEPAAAPTGEEIVFGKEGEERAREKIEIAQEQREQTWR